MTQTDSNGGSACRARNAVRLLYWTAAWVVTMAVAAFGPRLVWDFDTALTTLAVVTNLGVGFGMIVMNRRHLRGVDEMHQKIFLDAGALTLGVGLVCGLGYDLLEDVRLIQFEPEIAHLVILMCLTFLAGMIVGHQKYR